MQTFVFVSHSNADKKNPEFAKVLRALDNAGIPLGIDRPGNIADEHARAIPFVWSLQPDGKDFVEEINAGQIGAAGALFLASRNTSEHSWVWREFNSALTAQRMSGGRYDIWCMDLDAEAYRHRPGDLGGRQFHRSENELGEVVSRIKAHLQRVKAGRLARAAMEEASERHRFVDIVGTKLMKGEYVRLPLDRVYTALRGDILSASERVAATKPAGQSSAEPLPGYETPIEDLEGWIRRTATDHGLTASDNVAASIRRGTRLNIATAVRANPVLMILGEPASGKSTILRWLTLRFATAWLDQGEVADGAVTAPERQVDPDKTSDSPVEIGPLAMPILIPMSAVAAALSKSAKPDLLTIAANHIEKLCEGRSDVADIIGDAVRVVRGLAEQGRLLMLLDGLDEVAEPKTRAEAIEVVVAFAERWTIGTVGAEVEQPARRNRLVMTSRIVGYSQVRLPDSWPHVVVDRMSEATVKAFWKRLFDVLIPDKADEAASALHEQVFGDHGSSLEDIAGIPLLAAMLALTFRRQGALPQRRVEIYDAVVRHLVEERRPDVRMELTLGRWKRWICVVAKVMHERSDNGLISAEEYDRLLRDRHREIDEGNSLTTFERERIVRQFREANDAQVGLLVERAGEQYGFLHRTFQEYLAAAWLMDDPALAVDRLVDRWDDPAWREATLLAFGHESLRNPVNGETRDALIEGLFARTEEAARPRLAQFLCLAVNEMPDAPSERTVTRILLALIGGLRGEPINSQPDVVRRRLTDAIYAIADREPDIFETCLARLLTVSDANTVNALAELVDTERWRTPVLVEALRAAIDRDSEVHGYPVGHALRHALTDISSQLNGPQPTPDKPKRPELAEDEDSSNLRAVIRALSSRREHIHRMRRWRVGLRLTKFRSIPRIRKYETLLDAAESDRAWRAIAIALLGTLGEKDAARGTREYRRLSHWLQEPDGVREQAVDDDPTFVREFGAIDPIYSAAVYLDTRGSSLLGLGEPPVLDRQIAFPVVSLPEALLDGAELGASEASALWSMVRQNADEDEVAVTFLAACLANLDGRFPVYAKIAELPALVRARLRTLATQTRAVVSDGAFRSLQHLLKQLTTTSPFTPRLEGALVQAVETCVRLGGVAPAQLPVTFAAAGPRAQTEWFAFSLAMLASHDFVYNAAVALDELQKLDREKQSEALRLLAESACRPWTGAFAAGWQLVFPLSKRAGDLPPHIFDMPENSQLRSQKLDTAAAIQVIALFSLTKADGDGMNLALAPYTFLVSSEHLPEGRPDRHSVVARIESLGDPYLQCRGFLAIAECGLGDPQFYLARTREMAPRIASPLERFIVLDRLLEFQTGAQRDDSVALARQAAAAIDEPGEGWRACARMAARDPASRMEQYAIVAEMLDRIADPVERFANWRAARRTLGDEILRARRHPNEAGDDPMVLACNSGFTAPILLELDRLHDIGADAVLALYVAQVCNDVTDAIDLADGGNRGAHLVLGDRDLLSEPNADPGEIKAILARIGRERPALTADWAKLIETLADRAPARAVQLASAMRIDSRFSTSIAEDWLQSSNTALAFYAAAAVARKSLRRDRRILAVLLAEVSSDDEFRSAEACRLLTRGTFACRRPPRISAVADYGIEGLLELGRFVVDPANRSIRVIAVCALLDVAHDDAAIISQLCDLADAGGADAPAARAVLAETVTADRGLLNLLGERLKQGTAETQRSLIDALAAIAFEFDKKPVIEIARAAATSIKRPIRFLEHGGADIITAATTAIGRGGDLLGQVKLARELLLDGAVDLRTQLSDDLSAGNVLKAQFDSRTSVLEEGIPVLHASKEIEHFRQRFGSQGVAALGTWFTHLLIEEDHENEALPYLAFAVTQVAQRNPAMLAEAMVACAGGRAALRQALSKCVNGPVGVFTSSSALMTGCLIAPIDEHMARSLLQSVQSPLPDALRRIETILLPMNPTVAADALPVLAAALDDGKTRVAFVAIRLIGALVRNPRLSSRLRRQGRSILESLIASERGKSGVYVFSPVGEKLEGAPIQMRGTLRDAALLEIARADA